MGKTSKPAQPVIKVLLAAFGRLPAGPVLHCVRHVLTGKPKDNLHCPCELLPLALLLGEPGSNVEQ